MIMFGGGARCPAIRRRPAAGQAPRRALRRRRRAADPPATEQLIADGWGYASINPGSIQADNGAGLTKRHHRPRQQGPAAQAGRLGRAARVGVGRVARARLSRDRQGRRREEGRHRRRVALRQGGAGHDGVRPRASRWCWSARPAKAAPSCIAATGAKRSRTSPARGEYHWMAGNFLKYGAAEATFGSKNAGDIPVDAHELIALCAPRLTFISYGVPEKGDAKWLDHQGSFMAAIAAQPVFRLLGAKDLGTSDDYKTEKMPAVNVSLLDGQLAWRQHDGGHTDGPNWKYFIPWADKFLKHVPSSAADAFARSRLVAGRAAGARAGSAGRPARRRGPIRTRMTAHAQLLEKAKQGGIDVYFVGDSITRRWGATDYPELLANWKQNFFGWNAADFGWGADTDQNILWRLENGELDGVNPKVIVMLAGTNNVGNAPPGGDAQGRGHHARARRAIVDVCRQKAPEATIILTAIFPRNDNMAVMPAIDASTPISRSSPTASRSAS